MAALTTNDPHAAEDTIPHAFDRAIQAFAQRGLLVSDRDGSTFTFADAARVVRRIMARLRSAGVGKGDRICIYAPMDVEPCLLFWASANLGAIYVPLDYRSSVTMLRRIIDQVGPKVLFCDPAGFAGCPDIKDRVQTVLFDDAEGSEHHGPPVFSRWLDAGEGEIDRPEIMPQDPAAILYTSGSTGSPKGVVLSQGALCRIGRLVQELFGYTPDDRVLSLGELHAIGGIRTAVSALHAGCSFLITSPAQRSSVLPLVECIRKYRCTQFTAPPVVLRLFLQFQDRIPPSDLGSLRSIMSAGSILPQYLADSFSEHFGVPVLNCYGMTETAGMCISHSLKTYKQAQGSIGLPVGCLAEIVDTDGTVLPDGSSGELRIKSNNLMSGYYQDAELTRTILRDGWLYTGDLATRRADGHIVVTGRIKNIIKMANGYFVSLEEVESSLERHPLVREASVCGFTSSRGDDRLAAFIVPDAPVPAEELFRGLRSHIKNELGPHKVPAVFILKDALPRGATGKVLREQLKQEAGAL